jgi:hypothetical protein
MLLGAMVCAMATASHTVAVVAKRHVRTDLLML